VAKRVVHHNVLRVRDIFDLFRRFGLHRRLGLHVVPVRHSHQDERVGQEVLELVEDCPIHFDHFLAQ
jgi:hypothetical protein